jgi:hypothetical protein
MNIIFGKKEAELLSDKYTILELDTITINNSNPITAYCVVDSVPVDHLANLDSYKQLHKDLIENYKNRNWSYCESAIKHLLGFWGSDVDTFYDTLAERLEEYKVNEPDDTWTGIVAK